MTAHKMKVLAEAEVENEFEDAKSIVNKGITAEGECKAFEHGSEYDFAK